MNRFIFYILISVCIQLWHHREIYATSPKLVIVLSYDQMRGDYIERFRPVFSKNGFVRLADEGAYFSNAHYGHASNVTCAGHAVLMTGCNPSKTGIVSNDFFDPETQCACYCAEEPDSAHNHEKKPAPTLLLVPTLGDYVKEKYPDSKQVAIAIKDRAAILMAGKKARHVMWLDDKIGRFTTSDYYEMPAWMDDWHRDNPVYSFFGKTWNTVLDNYVGFADTVAYEGKMPGGDNVFPHIIPDSGSNAVYAFACTPYSVSYLFQTARYAIEQENMGKDSQPDIIYLGISTTDLVGHIFGPDSRETQELYYHCDTTLANFIEYLDTSIGREHYVIALCSDHGVGPIPELIANAKPVGYDAGRLSITTVKRILSSELRSIFPGKNTVEPIASMQPPTLFLNKDYFTDNDAYIKAKKLCVDFLTNYNGLKFVGYTEDIVQGKNTQGWDDIIFSRIKNSTHIQRSGDIVFFPKQYWIYGSNPASHGTPYDYDTHVPIVFFGSDILKKKSEEQAAPIDIAPTLGALLEITMPQIEGKNLSIKK